MINRQTLSDKTAISLSLLCAIHCLAMPLVVVFLPAIAGLAIADEAFHLWMVAAVLPVSIYALSMGCKKHKNYRVLAAGGVGLAILVATALAGHDMLGEVAEKSLTVLGACVIALGHFWNYKLCQRRDSCDECPEQSQ